jgi:hypothetical protein
VIPCLIAYEEVGSSLLWLDLFTKEIEAKDIAPRQITF